MPRTREVAVEINGYELKMTCGACPEQYDVFKNGSQVGYLRLRHGYFYASVPGAGGKRVYEAEPKGDGVFKDHERRYYLEEAVNAIAEAGKIDDQGLL